MSIQHTKANSAVLAARIRIK